MAEVCDGKNTTSGIKLFGATIAVQVRKAKEEPNTRSLSEDQTIKKRPDKIIPCPRCKSMDTKFCYFNNYNVNQPRHFCKGCQRYWTAGGSLRNVPIGAGRRKSKPPCRGLVAAGLSEDEDGCLFDVSGRVVHQFEFDQHDRMVEEWHHHDHHHRRRRAPEQCDFRRDFPAKRMRNTSNSQPC